MVIPIMWRLHLSQAWLHDVPRRSKASFPDKVTAQTIGDCATGAIIELASNWDLPVRPAVFDRPRHRRREGDRPTAGLGGADAPAHQRQRAFDGG